MEKVLVQVRVCWYVLVSSRTPERERRENWPTSKLRFCFSPSPSLSLSISIEHFLVFGAGEEIWLMVRAVWSWRREFGGGGVWPWPLPRDRVADADAVGVVFYSCFVLRSTYKYIMSVWRHTVMNTSTSKRRACGSQAHTTGTKAGEASGKGGKSSACCVTRLVGWMHHVPLCLLCIRVCGWSSWTERRLVLQPP